MSLIYGHLARESCSERGFVAFVQERAPRRRGGSATLGMQWEEAYLLSPPEKTEALLSFIRENALKMNGVGAASTALISSSCKSHRKDVKHEWVPTCYNMFSNPNSSSSQGSSDSQGSTATRRHIMPARYGFRDSLPSSCKAGGQDNYLAP